MPHPSVNAPVGAGGFVIEAHPATAGAEQRGAVWLSIANRQGNHFSAAGMAAVLSAFNTYYTSAKITTVLQRMSAAGVGAPGVPMCLVSGDGARISIPAEDVASLSATLVTILQTAANTALIR